MRVRNSSEPRMPAMSTTTLPSTKTSPNALGVTGILRSFSRRSQTKYSASGTMRKPWE